MAKKTIKKKSPAKVKVKTKKKTLKKGSVKKKTTTKKKNSKVRKVKTAKKVVKKSSRKKIVKFPHEDESILLFTEEHVETVKIPENVDKLNIVSEQIVAQQEKNITNKSDEVEDSVDINLFNSSQVHIGHENRVSPHIIDLKRQKIVSSIPVKETAKKKNFEDKLFNIDKRFQTAKANFITKESRKQASELSPKKQNKFLRYGNLLTGKVDTYWENISNGISAWSGRKVDKYLNQLADKQDSLEVIKPSKKIALKPVYKNSFLWSVNKSLAIFVVLALVLVLPIKAYTFYNKVKDQKASVLGVSTTVYGDLSAGIAAIGNFDFRTAENSFQAASQGLLGVKAMVNEYPALLVSLAESVPSTGDKIKSGRALVDAGNSLAQAGALMSQSLNQITSSKDLSPTEKLLLVKNSLIEVHSLFLATEKSFQDINIKSLPSEYQDQLSQLSLWLPSLNEILSDTTELIDFSLAILGHNEPQKYLLIFQNSNELRPTGGFIGSLAEIDLRQGEMKNFRVPPGGVYDLQGNLKVLLASPKPIHLLNANWQLQDSNWFFDFPTSAKKILWFYEKSGGPTVDGLIAINSRILPKLLSLTGPIYLPEYDVTIDQDNVIKKLQEEAEINYDKEANQPKRIISDLFPAMIDKLQNFDSSKSMEYLNVINESLLVKDIQIYHSQPDLQESIIKFGWGGEVLSTGQDYLALVDTNIGGGKTDDNIEQQVYLHTTINELGEIVNELQIIKQHHGDIDNYFTGMTNTDYLRVYVPQGSQLISVEGFTPPEPTEFSSPAEGFEYDNYLMSIEQNPFIDELSGTRVTEEFGKTVFGNWIRINPGDSKEIIIKYKLPFKINFKNTDSKNIFVKGFDSLLHLAGFNVNETKEVSSYTALWQKQSGQKAPFITHRLSVPPKWQITSSPNLQSKIGLQEDDVYYQTDLTSDKFWGVIFSK